MPCYSRPRKNQTLTQRKEEVKKVVGIVDQAIAAGRVRPRVGPQGGIAFEGWREEDRADVTDACAYRQIMSIGSALARAAIQRAELLAGRPVRREALAQGVHSHDGGRTWGHHH